MVSIDCYRGPPSVWFHERIGLGLNKLPSKIQKRMRRHTRSPSTMGLRRRREQDCATLMKPSCSLSSRGGIGTSKLSQRLVWIVLACITTWTSQFPTSSSSFCFAFQPTPPRSTRTFRNLPKSIRKPIGFPQSTTILKKSPPNWEGDDLRWSARVRRRFRRSLVTTLDSQQPARNTLFMLNVLAFFYQTFSSVDWIRQQHPFFWPSQALPIVLDALMGSSVPGPFALDFIHSNAVSRLQPHRLLSSGFLHGGILHLLVNMDTLRRLPSWLETGIGAPLYVTVFLVSIVTGNLGHSYSMYNVFDKSMCLGSSGGICGLYGLMYVSLLKMGNSRAASSTIKGLVLLLLYGLLFDNISNAAHVGGFLGGALVALLCGPSYGSSYSLRRKWSLQADVWPRDYRAVMGFGAKPSNSGLIPLPVMWALAVAGLATQARFRAIPKFILMGLWKPGSLRALLQ